MAYPKPHDVRTIPDSGGAVMDADKFIVFLVGANPHPFNATADFVAQGAIMIAYADGEAFATPGKFFETKWSLS